MSEQNQKGIDYVLKKTFKTPINGIHDLPKLKYHSIPIDNITTDKTLRNIQEARHKRREERKFRWKSLSTRSFRKSHTKFNKSKITFESFKPIANLWDEYASHITENEMNISRMDLHGAPVVVLASRDPSLVGVSGRVMKETYGAITIISEDDKVRQVNKAYSVLELQMPNNKYEINLDVLKCRPYTKSTKYWKTLNPLSLPF